MPGKMSTLRKVKMHDGKLHRTKRHQHRVRYLLKIIHLNDDCLEEIFFQLNLLELAKVADANVRLAVVAADVFARKYQHQEICIKIYGSTSFPDKFRFEALQEARMIIEHFGRHITKLNIDCGPFGGLCAQSTINHLSEHCSKTLVELKIGHLREGLQFKKPLVKLEKLVFYRSFCKFLTPMTDIAASFPHIRSIELQNVRYAFESIELQHHIPTLEHFGYYTFPYVKFSGEDLQSIHRFVQLNPQIKSLGMYLSDRDMSAEQMQPENLSMIPMPGIETIDAYCNHPMANGPFHFANVKHLKLNGICSLNRGWIEMAHQIEQLDLSACCLDEHMINFIVSCRNIKTLEITTAETNDVNMEHMQHIAKHLPSLNEVHFSVYKHNTQLEQPTAMGVVVEFMQHCSQLTKVSMAHDIDERDDCRSLYKHNVYNKSKKCIKLYRETIKRKLPPSSHQWRINHELKPVELIKGFEGFNRYLFFQVSFEKYCLSDA